MLINSKNDLKIGLHHTKVFQKTWYCYFLFLANSYRQSEVLHTNKSYKTGMRASFCYNILWHWHDSEIMRTEKPALDTSWLQEK